MITRCSCYNCGIVDDYELPYHTRIYEYDREALPAPEGSRIVLQNDEGRPLICSNCGWDMLIVVYWGATKDKMLDPVQEIRLARS